MNGALPSGKCIGSNDGLSRRDRGLEFLDVTDSLSPQMAGTTMDPAHATMTQEMMLTNRGTTPIDGDLLVVLTHMPAGAALMNAEGRASHMPGLIGMPYLRLRFMDGQLAPGAAAQLELQLQMTGTPSGDYGFRVLSGAGDP